MPTTRRRRTLDAPPDAVWAVITDPHHLPRWWPLVDSEHERRHRFAQELAGSPFERLLRSSEIEIALEPADGGTLVTMELSQKLRGASRLGGFMFRGAARRTLDEALESLERAVVV